MPVLSYSGNAEAQALAQEYFNVYSDWKDMDTGTVSPKIVQAGQTITYTVTVQLKKTPALGDGGLLSSSFNIKLTATSTASMSTAND